MKMGIFKLAWGNFVKRPWRTLILVLCISALVGMQLAATLIDASSRKGLELGIQRLGADLVAVPRSLDEKLVHAYMTGQAAVFYMPASVEKRLRAMDFIEQTSPQLYIKSLSNASCCSSWDVFLIGFDPRTDFTIRPWLSRHRDVQLASHDVIVGAAIQSFPGMQLRFFGQEFAVKGQLDPSGMGLDFSVFIPIEGAREMISQSGAKAQKTLSVTPDQISAVLIKLKPEAAGGLPAWKAAYEIERQLPGLTIVRPADITVKAQRNLSGTLKILTTASFAVWPVTLLLIGLVFMMSALERKRETGLMRALGATRLFVFNLFHVEALIISLSGAALGLVAGGGIVLAFERMIALKLEIPFGLPDMPVLLSMAGCSGMLAVVTGMLAAMLPAFCISSMEPYEAIRRPE